MNFTLLNRVNYFELPTTAFLYIALREIPLGCTPARNAPRPLESYLALLANCFLDGLLNRAGGFGVPTSCITRPHIFARLESSVE
jgi:hypothetical protein